MVNRFIFGHGVVIYFIMQSLIEKISKNSKQGNPTSAILFILTVATAVIPHTKSDDIAAMAMHPFLKLNFFVFLIVYVMLSNNDIKYEVYNVIFVDVISALNRVALNQSKKTFFIWSVDMSFIFLDQINIIYMQLLYEAVILCDCILNLYMRKLLKTFGVKHIYDHYCVCNITN